MRITVDLSHELFLLEAMPKEHTGPAFRYGAKKIFGLNGVISSVNPKFMQLVVPAGSVSFSVFSFFSRKIYSRHT